VLSFSVIGHMFAERLISLAINCAMGAIKTGHDRRAKRAACMRL